MELPSLSSLRVEDLTGDGLTETDAIKALDGVLSAIRRANVQTAADLPKLWCHLACTLLVPTFPFEFHKRIFYSTYDAWDTKTLGPPPAFLPTKKAAEETNVAKFIKRVKLPPLDLSALHRFSVDCPEEFWPELLDHIRVKFHRRFDRILERSEDPDAARWLAGARLNIAEAALSGWDYDLPAVVWADEAAPRQIKRITRKELAIQVQRVASALKAWGVEAGSAVAIDMPMTVEAIAAYLGIILSGCAAVSVAESFAAGEISSRIRISNAVAIFTQDKIRRGGRKIPLYDRVVDAESPRAVVLKVDDSDAGSLRNGDIYWHDFLTLVPEKIPHDNDSILQPHIADAYDVTGILFSSGTTGQPKAIPWTHVTPIRCASNAFFHQDLREGDVMAWPTSMGWMMGPWLVYAALFNGATVGLYLGSPLERGFGEFVKASKVSVLGLVPSMVRSWRATGCMNGLDWHKSLRCFTSSGEASSQEDYLWLMSLGGYCPVIEYCGGTEIGGAFISGSMIQPQSPGTFTTPVIGSQPVVLVDTSSKNGGSSSERKGESYEPNDTSYMQQDRNLRVIDIVPVSGLSQEGQTEPLNLIGEIGLRVPMLGVSQWLLNADHHDIYFSEMPKGLRRHGDMLQILPGGFFKAAGRCDDTFNIGGIKVSSVEIENAVAEGVQQIQEAAAVAVAPCGGGPEELVLFVVLHPSEVVALPDFGDELRKLCQRAVATKLNPLFRVGRVLVKPFLPRNASNKVMRRLLRDELMSPPPTTTTKHTHTHTNRIERKEVTY